MRARCQLRSTQRPHGFTHAHPGMAAAAAPCASSYVQVFTSGNFGRAVRQTHGPHAEHNVVLKCVSHNYQGVCEARTLGYLARYGAHMHNRGVLTPSAFVLWHPEDDKRARPSVWVELPQLSASMLHIMQQETIGAGAGVAAHLLCKDLLGAVAALHEAGVVHCDVKLANTALHGDTGRLFLMDYDSVSDCVTAGIEDVAQFPMCTITTRPPEWDSNSARRAAAGGYNPEALYAGDVFSAAMCCAEMLLGQKLGAAPTLKTMRRAHDIRSSEHTASYAGVMRAVAHRAAETGAGAESNAHPTMSRRAWRALDAALAKDPAARCSAQEFADALAELVPPPDAQDAHALEAEGRQYLRYMALRRPARLPQHAAPSLQRSPGAFVRHEVPRVPHDAPLPYTATAAPALYMGDAPLQRGEDALRACARDTVRAFELDAGTAACPGHLWYHMRSLLHALRAATMLQDGAGVPDVDCVARPEFVKRYDLSVQLITAAVQQGAWDAFVGSRDNALVWTMHALRDPAATTCGAVPALSRLAYLLTSKAGVWHCVTRPQDVARMACALHQRDMPTAMRDAVSWAVVQHTKGASSPRRARREALRLVALPEECCAGWV